MEVVTPGEKSQMMSWELVPSLSYRAHTHRRFKNYAAKHRPSTRKISVKFQSSTAQYSLMMDRTRSETCWTDF